MPTHMLLRSLFVATISSNRFLLIPALHLLSFLSKPNRSFLFNLDRNPVLKAVLKRTLYNQFCAGETEQETQACVKQLKDLGFKGVILTYAKEMVFDHKAGSAKDHGLEKGINGKAALHDADIEAWRQGTLRTLDLISKGDILALKTTGGGPAVSAAFSQGSLPPQQMLSALDELATKCKQRGIQIIIDAESQHWQHGIARTTLELMRKFNRGGKAVIYNTYQAYLKETPAVVQQHMAEAEKDEFTLGLKLVRGAYILSDNRALIHDTKEDTDNAYNTIAQGALRQRLGPFGGKHRLFPSVNLLLASHNRESVMAASALHRQRVEAGLPTVPVAYGQLHGMSDEVSFSLLAERDKGGISPEVFKCTTWGSMGNLGTPILSGLLNSPDATQFTHYTACISSVASESRLSTLFAQHIASKKLSLARSTLSITHAIQHSSVILLAVDPSQVTSLLSIPSIASAFHSQPPNSSNQAGKLVISVIAGLSTTSLSSTLLSTPPQNNPTLHILRALPTIHAQISHSHTAIQLPPASSRPFPHHHLETATSLFSTLGTTALIAEHHMAATTAVSGSTPAFWAVIVDAMVDAAVAVGLPREMAQEQVYRSMRGSAEMFLRGWKTGEVRDMGTSPEGCTIGGIMVLEEMGVRGAVGKALRESVTIAREMGREGQGERHVNDTRRV
ncbi:hypothetical protein COCCADRAFT_34872 [Bipolaris zeicola 26-R-13]|uniref:Proline dehydrogenase n=1 Tax=Cochliobolus carbonum (strain 26-R-13) TaxID=930089 RepID=W6YJ38_COCC2|nr:uncharacterized protein COCCADRAFT_34872 [Bipolaris zeicola 26-R-13]EUC35629.1 hypothetical protein COCCADRAFT_34872 [Bipolaris zeicola 26-R-13]